MISYPSKFLLATLGFGGLAKIPFKLKLDLFKAEVLVKFFAPLRFDTLRLEDFNLGATEFILLFYNDSL